MRRQAYQFDAVVHEGYLTVCSRRHYQAHFLAKTQSPLGSGSESLLTGDSNPAVLSTAFDESPSVIPLLAIQNTHKLFKQRHYAII